MRGSSALGVLPANEAAKESAANGMRGPARPSAFGPKYLAKGRQRTIAHTNIWLLLHGHGSTGGLDVE